VLRTESQVIEILDMEQVSDSASCEDCQFECSVFAPSLAGPPYEAEAI